ncbi:glycosyltransferase family 17-domain-containing protein [Pelagophyceae sp. CCMP2097]|nr:glycosyltransferase family 17-domain-containing protein [Pelagophyceae sp. CCMP2097]
MRRAAALWLCAVEASARYYALSPEDGAVLVSDKVYVAITLVDKIPEGSRRTWTDIGDAPSSQNALCVRAASQFVCWAGQSASSGYEWQFLDYTQAPGGGPTELLIEAYLKAADLSVTSETSSLVTAWKPAMLAGYAPSKAPSRRVFDVFPLFGGHEMDLFQIRTKELSGAVDVFVSVEADVAHSGLAKDVEFAHHRDRHPRFAEVNVTAHVARLTGSDSGNREEAQRDAALEALVQAGARPGDLVILNDADEVTSRAALDTALQCAAVLDAVSADVFDRHVLSGPVVSKEGPQRLRQVRPKGTSAPCRKASRWTPFCLLRLNKTGTRTTCAGNRRGRGGPLLGKAPLW